MGTKISTLKRTGFTNDQIVKVLEEEEAERREQIRKAVKKHRSRNQIVITASAETEKTANVEQNQTSCNQKTITPPPNPLYRSNNNILEFAGARPEEKPEGFGYSSHDGTISFTAAEITKLSLDCYALTNVYGQVRSLAESAWIEKTRPLDRKRAIVNCIKKKHRQKLSSIAPDPEEQQAQDKHVAEIQQDEEARALAVRNRILGGRRG